MIPLDTAKDVGETLRLLRQLAGMSQSDVDARSGVCFTRISRMERGVIVPDTRTLLRILAAMGHRLAVVPLATDGPETGLSVSVSNETASGVYGEGLGDSSGSTGRTDHYRFSVMGDINANGSWLTLACERCPWTADIEDPVSLRDLNERAEEHAEVCR